MRLDYKGVAVSVALSVIISGGIMRAAHTPQPQIVSVDLKGILQEFVLSTASSKIEGEALSDHVKKYTSRLERLTSQLAAQENFLILPKNAVLAGGMDITEQVKTLIEQGYGNEKAN